MVHVSWPIQHAHFSVLLNSSEHDNHSWLVVPNHLPEVRDGGWSGTWRESESKQSTACLLPRLHWERFINQFYFVPCRVYEVGEGGVCACLSIWCGVVVRMLTMYFHNIISYIRILYIYSIPIPMFYTYVLLYTFLIFVRESWVWMYLCGCA